MKRWYFWVLAPILLAVAAFAASAPHPTTVTGEVARFAAVAVPILATLGLANPVRFRWALRLVAGALLVAALASFRILGAADAALVLLVVGWPAGRYLVSGQT